jgi:hypothetical protein
MKRSVSHVIKMLSRSLNMPLENEVFCGEWEGALPEREGIKEVSELEASLAEADETARVDSAEKEAGDAEANRQRRREHIRQRMFSAHELRRTDRLLARLRDRLPEDEPKPDLDS